MENNSRRKFLGQASCAAIGSTTLFSTLFNIKAMNAAAIANSSVYSKPGDYKALVVILLEGGMDSYNLLVPRDATHYNEYNASRSNMALPLNSLRSIYPNNVPVGKEYGLHPSCQHMQSMFNNGDLSFVSNVGTLIQPTTKAQYYSGTTPLPLGLYSHSDQSAHWQTGIPSARGAQGWGGKMADMMVAANENTTLSMSISLSGSNLYQTGNTTSEFSMNGEGPTSINGYNGDWIFNHMRTNAINGLINQSYQNAFKKTYASTIKTGLEGSDMLRAVIDNSPTFTTSFTPYQSPIVNYTDNFTPNMEMIARTISGREPLGMSRQVFFVSLGGWDMHDNLLVGQSELTNVLDRALNSFNQAMIQLGVQDQVTTFSLSEFARTLTSNGDGTDHAWGSNTFVMGGAVNGKNIYGEYPSLALGSSNPQEIYGSLIPTTSTDQYFRDIALWYGVPPSEIATLFPNIGNFSASPLGFL